MFFGANMSYAKFGVIGKNNVLDFGKVSSDGLTASPAVELLGEREVELDAYFPNDPSLISSVDRFVLNPTFGYPFTINIYEAGVYARTFTNKRGDTAHRPLPANPGFNYFDTTLGKMIVWDGTAWVNMDGTALS